MWLKVIFTCNLLNRVRLPASCRIYFRTQKRPIPVRNGPFISCKLVHTPYFPTLALSKSGLIGRSSITSSQPAPQAPCCNMTEYGSSPAVSERHFHLTLSVYMENICLSTIILNCLSNIILPPPSYRTYCLPTTSPCLRITVKEFYTL
ncbi:unknown [Clostridium clostridioforme CAG:132]|uniref:Uncharacterized protein n=1 Tax=[Clostridium] clostridioforme CAG:132 TaxID=1263065 RepID=R6JSB3_9FIRM|nr:unknown [[Clostridium] clostridioforme CAG:132]